MSIISHLLIIISFHYSLRFYINGTRSILTCALPLVSLIVLNYKIHQGIR